MNELNAESGMNSQMTVSFYCDNQPYLKLSFDELFATRNRKNYKFTDFNFPIFLWVALLFRDHCYFGRCQRKNINNNCNNSHTNFCNWFEWICRCKTIICCHQRRDCRCRALLPCLMLINLLKIPFNHIQEYAWIQDTYTVGGAIQIDFSFRALSRSGGKYDCTTQK